MNSFKSFAALVLTAFIALACSKVETGRIVLLGDITGNPGDVIVVSYLPGHKIGYHYPEVNDGKFEFSLEDVEGFADLIVSVGGVEFGARVDALDTLRMSFRVNKYLEDVEVNYDGAHEKESRIWTDFYETYEHWSNYDLAADRDGSIPYEESLAKFEKNHSLFIEKHKSDLKGYYKHRSDLAHDLLKSIFLELISYRDGVNSLDNPEYVAMVEKVDPNDPDQVVFPMATRWLSLKQNEFEGSSIDKSIAFMKKYGKKLTNQDVNFMLADYMVSICTRVMDTDNPEIYEPFFTEIEEFTTRGSELVKTCRKQMEAALNSNPGKPVPDTILRTPDGQEVKLSSIFGKVIYVDVWATWCGPCIKEGPYFRALAEKYKDDGRICFISISTDDTDAPWLEFLAKEKPFWPQYRLDGDYQNDFCKKVRINTIPRFLLIDASGNFVSADCARPSSDEIEHILNEAMNL